MGIDTFPQKIILGTLGEELVSYYLTDVLKKHVIESKGFNREYDLIVNGKNVEVKTDVLSNKTGNVAIEHISLESHTAPIIIYLLPRFYWTTREKLKHLVSYWPDVTTIGDDSRKGTLLKVESEEFRKLFKSL